MTLQSYWQQSFLLSLKSFLQSIKQQNCASLPLAQRSLLFRSIFLEFLTLCRSATKPWVWLWRMAATAVVVKTTVSLRSSNLQQVKKWLVSYQAKILLSGFLITSHSYSKLLVVVMLCRCACVAGTQTVRGLNNTGASTNALCSDRHHWSSAICLYIEISL